MNKSNTKTAPKEKSQYAILSYNLFKAKKGTLALKDNRLSFTDYDEQKLVDVAIADIRKYKQYYRNLKLYTSSGRYKFVFMPADEKKLRKEALRDAYYAFTSPFWAGYWDKHVRDSGIMAWKRILDKDGIPDGRRNVFAYSLLFVIFPVLIFTLLALFGNITGAGAESAPRSYPELLIEVIIIGACFAGLAYVINTIRKNG